MKYAVYSQDGERQFWPDKGENGEYVYMPITPFCLCGVFNTQEAAEKLIAEAAEKWRETIIANPDEEYYRTDYAINCFEDDEQIPRELDF